MTALAVGRPTAGLRSLTIAVAVLLVVDPFLLHSIGFALSCAASVGIALWSGAIAERVPGPRPFAEALGVTVGAQVAVAPLLILVFGGVPLVAVPANLVVAPVAGPLTMLGLVGGVAGGLLGGPAAAVVTFPAYVCAGIVLLVARWAAAVPLTLGPRELLAAAPVLVVATGAFAVRSVRRATWRRARPRAPEPGLAVPPR
jgi:competence protein ComEC